MSTGDMTPSEHELGDGSGSEPPRRRPRRQRSRARIVRRRLVALGALAAVAVLGYVVVDLTTGGSATPPPPPTPTVVAEKPFRIVFPEGFTRLDMAERVKVVAKVAVHERHKPVRLSRPAYLSASHPRRVPGFGSKQLPLEGFLFPATYDFVTKTTAAQLVHAQLAAFADNWADVGLGYARSKNLTPYDVLIIASMVEKEAQAPKERPLIAAVIYNRLHNGMTLGIDATIRYGLHVPATQSLHQSELDSDNPYNTRKFKGLPPTPIANPGLASMKAAAHPAHVDYLYFVRKPDKVHHYFTSSFDDFVNHERLYGYG